jgi:hypothetical protein
MSLLVAVEAFLIKRARLAFCLKLIARRLIENLFLAFALGRHLMLPPFLLLLNHHHMIGVLLNTILSCFEHHMQLNHSLLHAIHMKLHNE